MCFCLRDKKKTNEEQGSASERCTHELLLYSGARLELELELCDPVIPKKKGGRHSEPV